MSFFRSTRALSVLAVITVLIVIAAYIVLTMPGSATGKVPSQVTINGKTISLTYTATTPAARETGLMNRKITNTTTMLFVFPSFGYYEFWMFDTNTSLDMIWINATGTSAHVVYIVTSAQPCYNSLVCARYDPTSKANYVLEAKAGFVETYGIHLGTQITLG